MCYCSTLIHSRVVPILNNLAIKKPMNNLIHSNDLFHPSKYIWSRGRLDSQQSHPRRGARVLLKRIESFNLSSIDNCILTLISKIKRVSDISETTSKIIVFIKNFKRDQYTCTLRISWYIERFGTFDTNIYILTFFI